MWADQQYQGGKGSQDRAGMTIEVIFALVMATLGHLWWLSSKEYTCSAGATGLIPGSGRFPRGGHSNPLQYSCLENPLQYSCLENPMDREAWWAIVPGVTQSWTWLSDLAFVATLHLLTPNIMRNSGLEEAQAGIKIAVRNINNLRYADNTTLTAESEEN